MRILEELWFGNITPNARNFASGSEYGELCKLLCRNEKELNAMLDEKANDVFQKYQDAESEMGQISECEAFISGFQLGAKIIIEVMANQDMLRNY